VKKYTALIMFFVLAATAILFAKTASAVSADCISVWTCTGWSACSPDTSMIIRTCSDLSCGRPASTAEAPATAKACTPEEKEASQPSSEIALEPTKKKIETEGSGITGEVISDSAKSSSSAKSFMPIAAVIVIAAALFFALRKRRP
jgi:hypothetical protein